jgi:oxygen-independent coproporphyrinogen-3 oxidase
LPLQTQESFRRTLDHVIQLAPERIAIFNFAYVPWLKAHQKLLHPDQMPDADAKLRLLEMTVHVLHQAGYEYIGMDHFAIPTDELAVEQKKKRLHRNFQGYSIHAGADLFGFGMSAISHFGTTYSQNTKDIAAYEQFVGAGRSPVIRGYRMSEDDVLRNYVIMRLMCDLEIDCREVERRFAIHFDEYFSDALQKLKPFVDLKLLTISPQRIAVEPYGRFVLRNMAMAFDAYLERMGKEKPVFSRTV